VLQTQRGFQLTQQGMDIVASTLEVFAKFVSGEMERWAR
jgi:hypothetical protein